MTPRDGQLDESPVQMSLALGRVDGDKDLLQELVHTFQEDLSERVAALTAAIRRGDDQETLAEELETLGRAGRLGGAAAVGEAFEREMTKVAAFLSSFDWKSL